MGCDIHIILEKKYEHKWVGIYATDLTPRLWGFLITDRDYYLFAKIADVRNKLKRLCPAPLLPRGFPSDMSDLSNIAITSYDGGYDNYVCHDATHLTVDEFCDAFLEVNRNHGETRMAMLEDKYPSIVSQTEYELFHICKDSGEDKKDYRVIIYFDN